MIPRHYGKQTIIAKFNSLNLTDIDGYVIIHVEKGDEIGCNSEPSYWAWTLLAVCTMLCR